MSTSTNPYVEVIAMRLLFISNLFPNPAAPHIATFNLQQIRALKRLGEVEVVAPISWMDARGMEDIARVREDSGIRIHHPIYYYPPGCLRRSYGWCYYLSVAQVARRLLSSRNFDLIYASWLYPDGWAAGKIAQQAGLPLFIKVHGTDVNRLDPTSPLVPQSLEAGVRARKVICVSVALKERLIHLGLPPDKLEVVYNGVDGTIFRPIPQPAARAAVGVDPNARLVLYVGNLKIEKGLGELLEAFSAVCAAEPAEEWQLVIIGSGSFRSELEKRAEFSAARVSLLGSRPATEIAEWMNAANVLCLPSYMEGIPNVVLEAYSCGTNVVATTVGGIPELQFGDGRLTLVPPRNVEALAKAIMESVYRGRITVSASFPDSWEDNARRLERLFTDGR